MRHIVNGPRGAFVVTCIAAALVGCLEAERGSLPGAIPDAPVTETQADADGSNTGACQLDEDCVGKVTPGPCSRPDCQSGVCAVAPNSATVGETCRTPENLCLTGVCDAAGTCAELTLVECAASGDTACVTDTCDPSSGECTADFAPAQTPCPAPLCFAAACDGSGQCVDSGVQTGADCATDNPCLANGECSETGVCIEQWVCPCSNDDACDDGLVCTVDTCLDETCVFVPVESACAINGACHFAGASAPNDTCRICQPAASAVQWTELACDDDNPCTDDSCDPTVGCVSSPVSDGTTCEGQGNCGPLPSTCQGGTCACNIQCTLSDDCLTNPDAPELPACHRYKCVEGSCTTIPDASLDAAPCGASDPCLVGGACSNGACVAQPVDCGSCSTCQALSETAYECQADDGLNGQGCDDGNPCTLSDTCLDGGCSGTPLDCSAFDGQCVIGACVDGDCAQQAANAGQPCDDGVACTTDEACTDGTCLSINPCSCVNSDGCNDGLACTTNVCNNGSCSFPVTSGCAIDGTCVAEAASNPSNACLVCDPLRSVNAWSPVVCDDDNACTDDTCQTSDGSCLHTPDDTNLCNDGEACSSDDACVDGACVGSVGCLVDNDCSGSEAPTCKRWVCDDCTCVAIADASQNGVSCDDGEFCTTGDQCAAGVCQGAAPKDCSAAGDGQCQVGVCDEGADACVPVNEDAGKACDDGDPCMLGETCTDNGLCQGEPKDCTALDGPCTTGLCNSGTCIPSVDNGKPCDDAEPCTNEDVCTSTGTCAGTWDSANESCGCISDAACSGLSDTCHTGKCDTTTNECFKEPSGEGNTCDDGDPCTKEDRCLSGGACQGTAYPCNDGKACTSDLCDGAGGCTAELVAGFCIIEDQCRSDGETKPGDACLVCDAALTTAAWSDNNGAACDDGAHCTNDDVCSNGTCSGTPYTCDDDGLTCTVAECGAGKDACVQVLQADACLIEGQCYATDEIRPNFPCQRCRPSTSTTAWTNTGGNCDDGDPCTRNDSCSNGTCAGEPFTCNDNKSCTQDLCDGQNCQFPVIVGNCLIAGACYSEGTAEPTNPCRSCESSNPTSWTPKSSGTACEDGLACTTGDMCDGAGICEGGGTQCNPDWCEEATCTPDGCDISLKPNHCQIGGVCFVNGDPNPQNPCQACSAAVPTSWSDRVGGCDDGNSCTSNDVCNGGSCVGVPYACDDGISCTDDICRGDGSCDHDIASEACLIAGVCYGPDASSPDTQCRSCQPGTSQTSWTSLPNGSSCTGSGLSCAETSCQNGACEPTYDPSSEQCFIGGTCYDAYEENPENECQSCEPLTAGQAWTAAQDGLECGELGNGPCSSSKCQQGSCLVEAAPELSACDDGDTDTVGDWCVGGACGGFTRATDSSHGLALPDRFERASRNGDGSVFATWTQDIDCSVFSTLGGEGCTGDVVIATFTGSLTADSASEVATGRPIPLTRHGLTEGFAAVGPDVYAFDDPSWSVWPHYTGANISDVYHGWIANPSSGAAVETWLFHETPTAVTGSAFVVCEDVLGISCTVLLADQSSAVAGFVEQEGGLYFIDSYAGELRVQQWEGYGWSLQSTVSLSGGGGPSAVGAGGDAVVVAGRKGTLFARASSTSPFVKINVPEMAGFQSSATFAGVTTFNDRFVVGGALSYVDPEVSDKTTVRTLFVVHAPTDSSSAQSSAWRWHEVDFLIGECDTINCWLDKSGITGAAGLGASSALYLFGGFKSDFSAPQERSLWLFTP